MKNSLLILLIAFFSKTEDTFAQIKFLASGSPQGITLFIADQVLHPESKNEGNWIGYNIYRSVEKNGEYKLLTKKPLSLAENPKKLIEMIGKANMEGMKKRFKMDEKGIFEKFLTPDKDHGFLAGFNFTMGRAMGLVYDDADAKEGRTYYYKISKVKKDGSEGEKSGIESATAGKPSMIFEKPKNLKAQTITQGILLSFSKAEEGMFRHVYRSEDSIATYIRVNKLKMMSQEDAKMDNYLDTTAQGGTKYYYTVATTDMFENLKFSDTVSARMKGKFALAKPQFTTVEVHRSGVELNWETASGLDSMAGFDIMRREMLETDDNSYTKINQNLVPANVRRYADATPELGKTYQYVIRAVAKDLVSASLSLPFPYIHKPLFPPLPPQNVKTEPQMKAVKISWAEVEETDLAGYMVFRGYSDNTHIETLSNFLPKGTLSYTDTSATLSKNITFAYYVKSFNKTSMESPYSKPVFASPLEPVKKPARMNSLRGIYTEFRGNELRWGLPMDRETEKVRLFRTETADTTQWAMIFEEKTTEGKFVFADTLRDPLKNYSYKMCAVSYDSIQADFSNILTLSPKIPDILPPAEVNIEQNGSTLRISWLPVINKALKSYIIYRRTYDSAPTKIAEIPKGTTFFEDKTQKSDTYYYVIKTLNILGKEGRGTKEVSYEIE